MSCTHFWLSGAFVTVKSIFYHKADFSRDAILALLFGYDFHATIYFWHLTHCFSLYPIIEVALMRTFLRKFANRKALSISYRFVYVNVDGPFSLEKIISCGLFCNIVSEFPIPISFSLSFVFETLQRHSIIWFRIQFFFCHIFIYSHWYYQWFQFKERYSIITASTRRVIGCRSELLSLFSFVCSSYLLCFAVFFLSSSSSSLLLFWYGGCDDDDGDNGER